MTILRDFPMEEIKTKRFQEVIDRFGFKKTLFVIDRIKTGPGEVVAEYPGCQNGPLRGGQCLRPAEV